MFKRTLAATAVLAGSAIAQEIGSAVVINSCSYPVYLQNTPSADGGYSPVTQTLNTGATYTQVWTQLSNGNGWSMKLSQTPGAFESNIMQYEYTWDGFEGTWGGTLWYDLSEVDGNPWDGNWELTATGDCTPRQAAYQYSTDDAYGEQSCPVASSITVQLCSGDSGSAPAPSSPSSSTWSPSQPAVQSAPTSASTGIAPAFTGNSNSSPWASFQQNAAVGTPTTLATIGRGGVTVTDVATEIVTTYVTAASTAASTATDAPSKRFEHFARHAHGHHRH